MRKLKVKEAIAVVGVSLGLLSVPLFVYNLPSDVQVMYEEKVFSDKYDVTVTHLKSLDKGKYRIDTWKDEDNGVSFQTYKQVKDGGGSPVIVKNSYRRDLLSSLMDKHLVENEKSLSKIGFLYKRGDIKSDNRFSTKAIAIPLLSTSGVTLFDLDSAEFDRLYQAVTIVSFGEDMKNYYLDISGLKEGRIIISDLHKISSGEDIRDLLKRDVMSKMVKTTKDGKVTK